jgi:hypothetical protein
MVILQQLYHVSLVVSASEADEQNEQARDNMKNIIKLAVVSALLTLGSVHTFAATNEVHGLTLTFTFLTQGPTTTNGNVLTTTVSRTNVLNRTLVSTLDGLTLSYTNASGSLVTVSNVQFTSRAALIIKVPRNGTPVFFVRDFSGTNKLDFDVSQNVSISLSDTEVRSGQDNISTGSKSFTQTFILTFTFDNGNGTSFSASGATTLNQGTIMDRAAGFIEVARSVIGNLSGTGTFDGHPGIVFGSFAVGSAKIETQ